MKVANKLPLFFLKKIHILFNFLIKVLYYICNKNQIKNEKIWKVNCNAFRNLDK